MKDEILPIKFRNELKKWTNLDDVVYVWESDANNERYKTFYIVTKNELIRMFGTPDNPLTSIDKQL